MQVINNTQFDKLKTQEHTLIHVLPKEHFEYSHLEGAINICVYETSFSQNVMELNLDKDSLIVVYGESDNELDARAATSKLMELGFTNIKILEAQEGDLDSDQILHIKDGKYSLKTSSTLQWEGANANGSHKGSIGLKSGNILVDNSSLSGEFIVDMSDIKTQDISEEEGALYLNEHLKSEDFFLSKIFPEASFSFTNINQVKEAYQTNINYILEGELSIRGISQKQQVEALISQVDDKLILNAKFAIDRTKWDILYGSAKFFKFLGMHKIFDTIYFDVRLELSL
ncbi:MAG: hypothetical protein COB07_07605 [Sulfurovum sp.]|nr:MAG: hypothetical protein COB07_07605 [Sulfurovum sp.]